MKKCPFCKAELQENARFCLYCMAQLDEKAQITPKQKNNKRLLVVICAVILLLIAVVSAVSILNNNDETESSDISVSSSVVESESQPVSDASQEETDFTESTDSINSDGDTSIENESSDLVSVPSDSDSDTNPVVSSESNDDTSSSTSTDTSNAVTPETSEDKNESSEIEDNSDENSETSSPLIQAVKYIYREAVVGDEWGSINVENAITIIGVESPSADGTYFIPDTIDGKRVIAIAQYAFNDENIKDTVKTVIVAESVKNIHNYAFADCYNMTDIYLCGEAVAGSPLYFLPKLENRKYTITLHASATCHDRNHRTYKSIYSYEEWTGHSIGIFEEWNGQ
ncbi:MAG: hypothetical protein J6Q89_04100 [Clostridia bacterium]|nr:hypothetical protein [Clostridia bacterium]